jgi:hypothetical protein
MARKRVEWSERESRWRGLVDGWRESGLTQEAFCGERGVGVASFRWWKWKLGLPGRSRGEGRREGEGPERPLPAFVPVRIVEPAGRREADGAGAGAFELELSGGWVVRVPAGFEAESLARLLAVVEGYRGC